MMKRNAIARTLIASAVLAVVGVAQAGSLTATKRTVANEAFGTSYASTDKVALPNVSYVFNTPAGIVVNDGGSVNVVFTIAGGRWSSSAALTAANAVASNLPAELSVSGAPVVSTTTTTNDTLTVTLINGVGAANTGTALSNATIGIGGTVTLTNVAAGVRFQATNVTKGTAVTVTGKVMNGVNVLEAETAAKTLVDYAQAVTATFTPSTETKKINLSAVPAGSGLTSGVATSATRVQLGKFVFADNADVTPVNLDTSAALAETNIVAGSAAFADNYVVTLTVGTGALTAKQGFVLTTNDTCVTAVGSTVVASPLATAVTAATTSVALTATAASAAAAGAEVAGGVFVCADYSGVAANGVISPVKPTIAVSYTKASATYTGDTLAANDGYDLVNNGQRKDVRSYIPAATTGYTSFVRAINTGSISAAITGQFVYEDGTTSASGVLGNLAAGGSVTWTSSQIESAIGVAPAATARPRLRLTAPTSGMDVQSFFLTNANGNFSDVTGAQ